MDTIVKTDGDKYTFVLSKLGCRLDILRYGQPWIANFDPPGIRAVIALLFKVEDLEKELELLKKLHAADLGAHQAVEKVVQPCQVKRSKSKP